MPGPSVSTSTKQHITWLLVLAIMSVLPFLLFAGFSVFQLLQAKQDDLQQQLIDRAQATANTVAERLSVSTGALQALASSDAAAKDDMHALYSQANRIVKVMPYISAIALITPDSLVQFHTLRPLGEKAFLAPDADSIRMVFVTGNPMVTEPYPSPLDNKVTLSSVTVPVLRDGKVVYCLRAIFRSSLLNALLAAQHLPVDWIAGILSRKGLLLARSLSPDKFVGKPAASMVLDALYAQRNGVFDALTIEGNATKAVVVPIPGWDWSVVVGVPSRAFLEPFKQANWFLTVFGIASLALGGIIVGWVSFIARGASKATPFNSGAILKRVSSSWPSAITLVIALSIGALSTQVSQNAQQEIASLTDQRQAIDKVRRRLLELMSAYIDIETGQRGFVITGDETFLEPYRAALPKIPLLTNFMKSELDRLGISNVNWSDLANFSSQRLASAARGIEMRRQLGAKIIEEGEFFDHGKLLMDKVRLLLGNLESQLGAETERINIAVTAQAQKSRQLQWLAQFGVVALVLLSISFWLYERRRRLAALGALEIAKATLEDRVSERTRDLSIASEKIKKFSSEAQVLLDNERKRLSREVHDQIGQIFTGIKLIVRTLKPGSLADDQQRALLGAIESGVIVSRRIAAELRPPLLDDFGLLAALDHYLKTTFLPLDMAFDLEFPEVSRLTATQRNQLFRMVQEACTNIIRHAQASQVDVTGRFVNGTLEVWIEDDGVGFDEAHVRADALGLTGIDERAKLSGAVFSIEPREAGGTRLRILFPADALITEESL